MSERHGSLSINSENIFPIIKKWLYSDHDIFFRELISNGCDAITKLKKLEMMGEYTFPEDHKNRIQVLVNPEEKTLKFIDTGLGMDADEVEEYINQIAFSGATDFLAKYKDKTNEDQIIGHFGLGFYSAFMVADEVHIDTLSYKEGAVPVHWECDGGTEFFMTDGNRTEVGTTITLFLNEESVEFANEYRAREVIQKYCSFMPTEIFLFKEGEEVGAFDIEEDAEAAETEGEEKEEAPKKQMPVSLSDTAPLWTKHPNECEKEQYLEFYRKVFHDYKEPLFWIHLNMDYPFNLKGILYFPKINTEYDSIEGTIKLYNNQVFIADNIKEVIPEFLMLLKGVIDCPDLPLNVSRSALQNDGFVKKISDYITKKVADRLSGMCKTQRDDYEKYWDDINPFIKFGCIKDEKFSNKMMDYILYKDLDGKYLTLKDLLPGAPETEVVEDGKEEKKTETIFYVTDEIQQSQYINMFRAEGKNAVILRHNIDSAFVTHVERANESVHFQRIDADLTDDFKENVTEEEMKETTDALTELFRKALDNENLLVKVEKLKNEEVSSMVTLSEESRRMQEMMRMYGMPGMDPSMFGGDETLVLNANNKLVQYVLENKDGENTNLFCEQLYDLAMISHKPLSPEAMTKFIARSNQIMMLLAK